MNVRQRTDARPQKMQFATMYLHEFLTSNRPEIINRCRQQVAKRFEPTETGATIDHGVPLFLEQLVETLREEQDTSERDTDATPVPAPTKIGRAAALHGAELLRRGFSVDQVVHDYGDVCQCVTALAVEQTVSISTDEFRTLNRCLDNAIADAVASFAVARQRSFDRQAATFKQRLDDFAGEHKRLIEIAIRAFGAIKTGNIGTAGATGALLDHAMEEISTLTNRAFPETLLASASNEAGSS